MSDIIWRALGTLAVLWVTCVMLYLILRWDDEHCKRWYALPTTCTAVIAVAVGGVVSILFGVWGLLR